MKKATLLSVLILFSAIIYSQAWENLLPKNKKENGTLTLHDYQNAFNTYWASYNIDSDGYYIKNGEKTKAAGWKQFKRWEHNMQHRVNKKTGAFPQTSDYTERKKYLQKFPEATKNVAGNWTSKGMDHYDPTTDDANGIGQMGCIAFHPTDVNTFWVGAGFGGLWKTSDGGNTWQVLNDDLGVLGIADIAIPSDYDVSQTIYIGTGSRDTFEYGSLGVLKSTDGGLTWDQTPLAFLPEDNEYVFRLVIDPNNNQVVFASTTNGVFKSTDGANTWIATFTSSWMKDLEFHPTNSQIIYGGSNSLGNIYRSTDGGQTWNVQTSTDGRRVELAVSEDSPNTVYAIASDEGGGMKGIYKSLNSGGYFWRQVDGQIPGNNYLGFSCYATDTVYGQGHFDICIAVNPQDADEVFIGGILTWKSTNGGSDWDVINDGYNSDDDCLTGYEKVHVDQHWLEFQPGSNKLFEVNDGGVYKSTDNEYNWVNLSNGLEVAQIERIGVSQTNPDMLIAGIFHNGSKRLSGGFWESVGGADGMNCIIDYTDENIQYASKYNGSIFRTMDNWATSPTDISNGVGDWLTPFVLDPVNPNIFYVGTKQLHKSIDRGDNYNVIFDPGDNEFIKAIAVAPSNTSVIYCSNDSEIWRIQNGVPISITNNLPLGDRKILSIAVKETNKDVIWVSLSRYDQDGVYKSINGGQNWVNISYGLPDVPILGVIQNKLVTSEEEIYAATTLGVFVKVKESTAWVPFNNQLPYGPVREVEIYYDGNNSKVIAGTWGRGVWESDLYSYESNAAEIWTGIKSSDWFDGDNWQYGSVPGGDNNVTITSGVVMPVIAGGTAYCNSLTIESGATLEIVDNLNVNGNFTNHGELVMSGSNPDIDIAGNITFEDGSTGDIQSSNALIKLGGSWIFEEFANAQLNQGIVVFDGSNNKYVRSYSPNSWFNNITIFKDPGKYIYFSSSSTNDLIIKGYLLISADNLYRQYSGSNTVIEGALHNYGRIMGYGGGIELAGVASTIQSNGDSYFNNLILSSGTNSIYDDLEVRGDLIFNGGTLYANTNDIVIEGNWINNISDSAFIGGTGKVYFEGDDGQSITGDVNFNHFVNNISSGYIDVVDEVLCNKYYWQNGGIRVDHDNVSSFIALDLKENGIYGDFILDNGHVELHSPDYIHLNGNLTINGGTFEVHGGTSDSYWPGSANASISMTDGVLDFVDNGIHLQPSASYSLNMVISGGVIRSAGSFFDFRGDFNPTGGEVELYGSNDSYIMMTPGSSFYKLNIAKGIGKNNSGEKGPKSITLILTTDVEVSNNCDISDGVLDVSAHSLNIGQSLFIRDGGILKMTHPFSEVNVARDIIWQAGSQANITDGLITCGDDWFFNEGTLAQLSGTNQVVMNSDGYQEIKAYDNDACFADLSFIKSGGQVICQTESDTWLTVAGNMLNKTAELSASAANINVQGNFKLNETTITNLSYGTNLQCGTMTLNGEIELNAAYVTVINGFGMGSNGTLTLNSGSFTLDEAYNGSLYDFGGLVDLNGGSLQLTNNGMELGMGASIVFNGGSLKLGGNFNVPNSGTFNPGQGAVEFIGSNNGWINMVAGNSFHDLVIDKDVSSYVLFDSEITIDNDLIVQSGELKGESNAFEVIDIIIEPQGILNPQAGDIVISGNWTNNHGDDGFIEDYSTVTFVDFYYDSHILSDEVFNILNIEKVSTSGSVTLPDTLEITALHFNINSGKFITGGNLKIGGNFNVPYSGTFNPTQGFVEFIGLGDSWVNIAAGNHFNDLIINKANYGQVELLNDIIINNNLHITSGELMLDGNNVEVINITIESLGILNSGGSNIEIHGNWANYHSYDGFIEDGSNVKFIDYYYQSNILTEDQFDLLSVQKSSSIGSLTIADGVGIRTNQLEIFSGKFITGDNTYALIYNDVVISPNSSLIMPDAPSGSVLTVGGEFSVDNNALLEIGSGNDVTVSQFIHDGELAINGGSFDCTSSLYFGNGSSTNLSAGLLSFSKTTPTWMNLNGQFNMSGGIVDAQSNSIRFDQDFIGNLTGGSFMTGGSFKTEYDNIFQQNGGEVVFTGDADSTLFLADGCYFNDFVFNRTGGSLTLLTDLNIENDFTLNSGYFDTDGLSVFVGRNWANYAGLSAINLSSGSVYFNSDKPASILTDETFSSLLIEKTFADGNYLDVAANKTIQVNKHFLALDGCLRLNNNSDLSVNILFRILDGAGINVSPNASTASLHIRRDWDNYNTVNNEYTGFFPSNSTVIFDGTSDQEVNGVSFEESFYNLVVQKPSGEFKPNVNMSITNDIIVDEGIWSYGNTGLYYDLYGNLTVNANGSWQDDQNTLYFSSGDDVAFSDNSTAGSVFGNININLGLSTTNLLVNTGFNCKSLNVSRGNAIINNVEVRVNDLINVYDDGTLAFENSSILKMANNSQVLVSSGLLSFLGTETESPLIIHESTGYYSFIVENSGTLIANYTNFEFMDSDGVQILNNGLIGGTDPFQNCSFSNGEQGGSLLSIDNDQVLEITNAIFPDNIWGGLYNVSKPNNNGQITFIDAQGDFSGDGFESDPYNRVSWEGSDIHLEMMVFLEGPFNGTQMNTHLSGQPEPVEGFPLAQPYNIFPWNYSGAESVTSIPANVVDWVLIELRDAPDTGSAIPSTMIAQQAAFLLNNGSVVGLDGSSNLVFDQSFSQSLFVVVYHRNHLPVMTANPVTQVDGIYGYNFISDGMSAYGTDALINLDVNIYGMYAADANADGDINLSDKAMWKNHSGEQGYISTDFNMDGQVSNPDKNDLWITNEGESGQLPE